MTRFVGSTTLALLALISSGCCNPMAADSLAVPLRHQQRDKWCWAASAQMILGHLGTNIEQVEIVEKTLGPPCTPPSGDCPDLDWDSCNMTHDPVLPGYRLEQRPQGLSWSDLKTQLCSKSACGHRPFFFTHNYTNYTAHVLVAHGYKTALGENFVEFLDPGDTCSGDGGFMRYDLYLREEGHYEHGTDYVIAGPAGG